MYSFTMVSRRGVPTLSDFLAIMDEALQVYFGTLRGILSSNPGSDRKKMKVTNSSELISDGVYSLSFFRKTHSLPCSV